MHPSERSRVSRYRYIEIDAMNRYIHDGTVARDITASYIDGYVCGGWGQGGLAIHCIVAGRYDNANYDSR